MNLWIPKQQYGIHINTVTHLFYFIENIKNLSFAKIKNGTFNYLGTLF